VTAAAILITGRVDVGSDVEAESGLTGPDALCALGGIPMLVHAARALSGARFVDVVLVAVATPSEQVPAVEDVLASHGVHAGVRVVSVRPGWRPGVADALRALPGDADTVLLHDAHRPLAPTDLVDAVAATALAGDRAVVPGLLVPDSVKQVGALDDAGERVLATLPRADFRSIQTPQGFDRAVLSTACGAAGVFDDSANEGSGFLECLGVPVKVLPGSPEAFKITTPADLILAEAVLAERRANGEL
jgi:2-C-methyl-D-erythritol 4-phosphate cytidylyltransferase